MLLNLRKRSIGLLGVIRIALLLVLMLVGIGNRVVYFSGISPLLGKNQKSSRVDIRWYPRVCFYAILGAPFGFVVFYYFVNGYTIYYTWLTANKKSRVFHSLTTYKYVYSSSKLMDFVYYIRLNREGVRRWFRRMWAVNGARFKNEKINKKIKKLWKWFPRILTF